MGALSQLQHLSIPPRYPPPHLFRPAPPPRNATDGYTPIPQPQGQGAHRGRAEPQRPLTLLGPTGAIELLKSIRTYLHLSYPHLSLPRRSYLPIRLELTHDLAHTLLPLDLRGYYFMSQGVLAHHSRSKALSPRNRHTSEPYRGYT